MIVLALVLVGGAAFGAYSALRPLVMQLSAGNDYSGAGTGSVEVTIVEGASGRAIGQLLQEAGVVKSSKAFVDAAAANPKSGTIQPGRYTLRQKMSASAAVALLLDPAARSADRVTVREGLWLSETLAVLSKASGRPVSEYLAALKDAEAIGLPPAAGGKAEGWLFPDTYEFAPDATAAQQLAAMVARARGVLNGLGVAPAQAQRVLIVASLVQGEGSSPADFGKVARVIDNRLADKLRNGGRLQLDSTVNYAVGKRAITTTDAERAVSSRYNTYRYGGLPIGPINSPGEAAIKSALAPTPGPWLFFVTVDPSTGQTKFATTPAEHAANVRQFQAWCRARPGTC